MTFRETLYTRLPVWLAYITAGNGYINTLDAKKFFKGVVPPSAQTQHLSVWYYLGDEKTSNFTEGEDNPTMECSLYIGIYFKADNKEAGLINFYEALLGDMYKWLYRGSGITANKWFIPDSEVTGTLGNIESFIHEQANAVMSFKENFGEMFFEIKIKYILQA